MNQKIGVLLVIVLAQLSIQASNFSLLNVDEYLQQQEAQYPDITAGAEKKIMWAAGPGEKTGLSIIYLHGYSATRQESAPLTDHLGQALNANVFHTRLTGHGRSDDKMTESSVSAWKNDVLEAYDIGRTIGEKVIVVSVSTGGTLSTWLSSQNDVEDIAAQIMISPNFDIPHQGAYRLDWPLGIGVKLAEWSAGKIYSWKPLNALQEKYWNTSYPMRSIRPMIKLLKEVKKIDKQKITIPTQIIYSSKDTVVLPSASVENFSEFGSKYKELHEYNESDDPSNHVLAGYILSPKSVEPVLNMMLDFLYKNKIGNKPLKNKPRKSLSVSN